MASIESLKRQLESRSPRKVRSAQKRLEHLALQEEEAPKKEKPAPKKAAKKASKKKE